MDLDPQNISTCLADFIKRKDGKRYDDAAKYMHQLNAIFTNELATTVRDAYIVNIFNKTTGVLNFVQTTRSDKSFKKAKLGAFEVLYTLANNFPQDIKNSEDAVITCLAVYASSAYDEKIKALELLMLFIQRTNVPIDVVEKIYLKLYDSWLIVKSDTEQSVLTKVLGVIAQKHPASINAPADLLKRILSQLENEVRKEKPSMYLVAGSFEALSNFFDCFETSVDDDIRTKIYDCVFRTLNAEPGHRKFACRAALLFIGKHANLIAQNLYTNTIYFHESVLLKYLSLGHEEQKAAFEAVLAYYREVANLLKTDVGEPQKHLANKFLSYFTTTLNKPGVQSVEVRVSIHGLGVFAEAFYIHLESDEFSKLVMNILQNVEHAYLVNSSSSKENLEYLPAYVQTISNFMLLLKSLTNNQILCFQQLLILLIKIFPQLSVLYHKMVIQSFVSTLYHILKLKDNDSGYFLNQIVYQGIIWSCSHPYPLEDSELETVSYRNYLPFWNGVLKNTLMEKSDMDINDRRNISSHLFDELIKTLFVLINKLNLNTKAKDHENALTNPESFLEVEQINDYGIFLNVVDLYKTVLANIDHSLMKKWLIMFSNQIILKISKHPLISGFYKLLGSYLSVCSSLQYFEQNINRDEEVKVCANSVQKCIKEMLWKMKQFNGELQIACLEVLIATPAIILTDLLPCSTPAFVTLFTIGRSYLHLAHLGLETLKRWNETIPPEQMRPFLELVIPCLDSYLKSKSLQQENVKSVLKTRKTKQVLKKRKVLVETEPELLQLQKNILSFIGTLSSDLCYSFVNYGGNTEPIVSNDEKLLKLVFPYEDFSLNFYVDNLLPKTLELVQFCSNRKTRMAACELLQGIVMLLLGTSRDVGENLSKLNPHLKTLIGPLLRLGCDLDEPVQKLFKPLVLSLIHWYTHRRQFRSAHTAIFVEALLDGITHPDDSAIRDFSGLCLKEFVIWTIKQSEPEQLAIDPANIKVLVNNIISFSLHCDPNKRLGAALIFNNIYREVREEEPIFNAFWLEILYAFIMNISLTEVDCPEDNNCLVQVSLALSHVERGFVEKCQLFNKTSGRRRIPPDFNGTLLKDVVLWLLQRTGSKSSHCREKSGQLFKSIAPLVAGCNSPGTFIDLHVGATSVVDWVISTYEVNLGEISVQSSQHLFEWLDNFHCALDGYTFLLINNMVPEQYTNESSKFLPHMKYFLDFIHNRTLREVLTETTQHSTSSIVEKELFGNVKSQICLKILKFCAVLLKTSYLNSTPDAFWNDGLYNLICNTIFDTPSLGFDIHNAENTCKQTLLDLLLLMKQKLPFNRLSQVISGHLVNRAFSHTNINRIVPLKQRLVVKGMLMLQESAFANVVDISSLCNGFVGQIFEDVFEGFASRSCVAKNLNHTSLLYCSMKLELALTSEKEFENLVECLFCQDEVRVLNGAKTTKCGLHFFDVFKEVVVKSLLGRFGVFLDKGLERNEYEDTVYYLIEIFKRVRDNKNEFGYKSLKIVSEILLEKWSSLEIYFNRSYENILHGVDFLLNFSYILPYPLYVMGKDESAIGKWILSLLSKDLSMSRELTFNFRMQIVTLLPCVVGLDQNNEELSRGFNFLKQTYFSPTKSISEVSASVLFNKLLEAFKISKSTLLLRTIAEILITGAFDSMTVNVQTSCGEFTQKTDTHLQFSALELIYSMFTESFTFDEKYKLAVHIFSHLLLSVRRSAFERFYCKHLAEIRNDMKTDMVDRKTISFILVEILFFRIDFKEVEEGTNAILKAVYNEKELGEKRFVKEFTGFCLKTCKETYTPINEDSKNIYRLYQCHSYNTLAAIAVTIKNEELYKFLFMRKDHPDVVWRCLLDLEKKYEFEMDFDIIPAWKTRLVKIRSDIGKNLHRVSDISTVNYLQSHTLFNSTLCEDVRNFDFTTSTLRTQITNPENVENTETSALEIKLESLEINNHECMATICGLIEHLAGTIHVPTDLEDLILPPWMECLKTTLTNELTHKNVKVFLAKVLENTKLVFQPFARHFFAPVMKLIVDGHIGSGINFFVYDLVAMISEWSVATGFAGEKDLASRLLRFLTENAYSERRDMYKSNLELIKTFVECWKVNVDTPHDVIYAILRLNSAKVDVAVEVSAVLLANKIIPWGESPPKEFLMCLSKILKQDDRLLYLHAAETIGMILKIMNGNIRFVKYFNSFRGLVYGLLEKMSEDKEKFLYCLERIVFNYPQIADRKFLAKLISRLAILPGNFKCMCLRVLVAQATELNDYLGLINFTELLTDVNSDVQILCLEFLLLCLDSLDVPTLQSIVQNVSEFTNNSDAKCRELMYDVVTKLYCKYKQSEEEHLRGIKNTCKNILILGLVDNSAEIQQKMYAFWSNEGLPNNAHQRFLHLLDVLYNPSNEQHYLGYSTYMLLDVLKSSDRFDQKVYEHPLENCTFQEYKLYGNWRAQHASVVPMFADTLRSQTAELHSYLDVNVNVLRATQKSLAFTPTQNEGSAKISSSLLFTVSYDEPQTSDEFKNPNYVDISRKYKMNRRFHKDKAKISKSFAQFEVKKIQTRAKNRVDLKKERERGVTFYRKYRAGDFPDIGITLSDVIVPLQVLVQNDTDIARVVYTTLFEGIVHKIHSKESYLESVQNSINKIFQETTQYVPNVMGAFFDILLTHNDAMRLAPNVVTEVCRSSGLVSVGTLLLEEYLIQGFDDVPSDSKKSRGNSRDVELEHWARLAELYKEMDEWDVVRAIFVEKMNCSETLVAAVKAEAQQDWKLAQEHYHSLIEEDASLYNKDFYYDSYFKCFQNLGEWEQLSSAVKNEANQNFWDQDWNQKKLLPFYIVSGLRTVLARDKDCNELLANINEWTKDGDKFDYLKANFAEELAVFCLHADDFDVAKQYLQINVSNFLECWPNLSNLFTKLRYNSILKIRNTVDLTTYADEYNKLLPLTCEESVPKVLNYWQQSSSENLNSIVLNETKTLYRKEFVMSFRNKLKSFAQFQDVSDLLESLNKTLFQIDSNLIKVALHCKNFYLGRKYYTLLYKEHQNSHYSIKEEMHLKLLICKLGHLKSQCLKGSQRMQNLLEAWKQLQPVLTYSENDIHFILPAKKQLYSITKDVKNVLKAELNGDLIPYKMKIEEYAEQYEINSPDKIQLYGVITLQNAVNFCHQQLETLARKDVEMLEGDIADAYMTLAHFAQHRGQQFEKNFICSVVRAMKLGSLNAIQLFPCLLDIDELGGTYKDIFITETDKVASWMFLRWIPQLLAIVDTPKVSAVAEILVKIATTYPQAIMYAYRLSKEGFTNVTDENTQKLLQRLDSLLLTNELVDKFLRALACVSVPANVLQYHVKHLMKACVSNSSQVFDHVVETIKLELFSEKPNSKDVNKLHGNIYKDLEKQEIRLNSLAKKKFDSTKFQTDLKVIQNELKAALERKILDYSQKLADYSPWLHNFHACNLNADLEIPGQYSGLKRPLVQYHVKISSFAPTVQIMRSLRKPIKLMIIGNDAKEYPYLVKFGEDLRQDQRVEQLLHLINDVLRTNPETSVQDLSIYTYQVVPLMSNLGIIEWVDDTADLNEFMIYSPELKALSEKTVNLYQQWINDAKPHRNSIDLDIYGNAAKKYGRDRCVAKYQEFVSNIPWNVLRNAFQRISITSESYVALRNNFIKTYSVLCTSHWLLGIGDRHLSNTMISLKTGKAIGIDFGYAFGTATQLLPIPEMVPFRLTPHIVNLMLPLGEKGLFKETMINVLRVVQKSSESLLSTMSVFIKEPSLEWKEYAVYFASVHGETKIVQTKRKLEGVNPVVFSVQDLEANRNIQKYKENYIGLVKGKIDFNIRAKFGEHLTVEDQVECLIDLATDYNLLGRLYVGYQGWM